jgi:phosphoglycolate phosphatase
VGDADVVGRLPSLIVFDLDGTLIDSRQDLADSANALIVERGGSPLPDAAIARMVGEGAAVLVRRALAAAGLSMDGESVARFLAVYEGRLLRTTRPYRGVVEALRELAGASTLAVLTNKPIGPTRAIMDGLDLASHFATMLGGDGPLPRKPDPASLRHLMSMHGTGPGETVLVGDSHVDLQTARAAGTAVCLARYGFGFESLPSATLTGDEAVADDPSDLPRVLRTRA